MTYKVSIKTSLKACFAVGVSALLAGTAQVAFAQAGDAVSMQDAINVAVSSNPEVGQAQFNTEAIQFERRQAQGLYAPRVDIEGNAGVRRLENPTRRTLNIANDVLYPLEAQARAEWTLLDFGRRHGELLRQAARVDGASLRVVERSEFVALQVARQYLDLLLQQRIVAASQDNVQFHQQLVNDLATGVEQGSISIADQQQAQERLQAAIVRQAEAEQAVEEAKIALRRLTGLDISSVQVPATLAESLPETVDEAVGLSRANNPRVREAEADEGAYVPGLTVTPHVTDRHAEADVGGRIDTTKQWRLAIPDPTDASARYRTLVAQPEQNKGSGAELAAANDKNTVNP